MCGLLRKATLFKIKPDKINIAVKVFQRSIVICIFNAIKMSWMFSYRQEDVILGCFPEDSESEVEDIDKTKNVSLRAYDQGMVTYEQNKLGLSVCYDKRYVLADGIYTRPLGS